MYKQDLVLNNPQGLTCHQTSQNQIKQKYYFTATNETNYPFAYKRNPSIIPMIL